MTTKRDETRNLRIERNKKMLELLADLQALPIEQWKGPNRVEYIEKVPDSASNKYSTRYRGKSVLLRRDEKSYIETYETGSFFTGPEYNSREAHSVNSTISFGIMGLTVNSESHYGGSWDWQVSKAVKKLSDSVHERYCAIYEEREMQREEKQKLAEEKSKSRAIDDILGKSGSRKKNK
jgi:hypothetical protein